MSNEDKIVFSIVRATKKSFHFLSDNQNSVFYYLNSQAKVIMSRCRKKKYKKLTLMQPYMSAEKIAEPKMRFIHQR